jgi:hypothetical protein
MFVCVFNRNFCVCLVNEKNELKDKLSVKEKEINVIHENYRNYLEKAKVVIKSLDPSYNQATSSEIQTLKNQVTEKEKKIKQLVVSINCLLFLLEFSLMD